MIVNIIEEWNNRTETLSQKSYGFRDIEFFKLKFAVIRRVRYQLRGWT